ncbi:MAG: thermonuclease family protein, partial [Candidatus Omnitrophica bacterium]|nr:thermonuclease family protein [Candidatus Omnitrophota bacterium]
KSAPRGTFVTWSQYKALLSINDVREREWYEQLVQEESLNRDQLVQAIKNDRYTAFKTPQSKTVSAQTIKRPDEATYVYKAIVERVIDGDTVLVRLDLGFQVWKEQRVRLACLDCPAMDEPGGEEAYHYARDQLARAGSVVVKTNKIDIYGRYVGHVFYSFEEMSGAKVFAQGRYLNEELVSGGMARVV